jgi:hypothetical protein
MSIYKCKTVPPDRLIVTHNGVYEPLCNSCGTKDCTNPIEYVQISIMGETKKWRLYRKANSNPSIVINCNGYSKE